LRFRADRSCRYSDEYISLLTGIDWNSANVEEITKLRMVSSKYCHAVEFHDVIAFQSSLQIRKYVTTKLTSLVNKRLELISKLASGASVVNASSKMSSSSLILAQKIIMNQRSHGDMNRQNRTNEIMDIMERSVCDAHCHSLLQAGILHDLPEIMKLACELSYELLLIVGSPILSLIRGVNPRPNERFDPVLRNSLHGQIVNMLDMLTNLTPKSQHQIVLNMKTSLLSTMEQFKMIEEATYRRP
jgi:hypothetical protein